MKPYQIALILAALSPSLAAAQVTVDPAALAQLAGIAPARPAPVAAPKPPVQLAPHEARRVIRSVKPAPVKPLPTIPASTAAKPVAPTPVVAVPPGQVVAVPPAPVLGAHAPQPVAAPQALVVDFPPGSASLPAGTGAALKPFCESHGVIGIDARAPADPSDPSVAMRLSLARALALRDALTSCGVASQNILPRALGSVPGMNEDQAVLGVQK